MVNEFVNPYSMIHKIKSLTQTFLENVQYMFARHFVQRTERNLFAGEFNFYTNSRKSYRTTFKCARCTYISNAPRHVHVAYHTRYINELGISDQFYDNTYVH